ncbi:MAG: recombination regulator RecX [Acidobacteriota bacterium]|nr:recombination regulator RecX [Acidobacteriota bacterium]
MAGRKPKLLDRDHLYEYALRTLGGRAYSLGELREKLRRRAAAAEDIEGVLGRLKEHGYLNDKRYADNFAAARLENEGFGRGRVLRDLRQHRVAPALAEQAVQRVFQDTDEVALIESFLARKYRGKDLGKFLGEEKNLAGAYRRLRYAGFGAGTSIRVLKRYASRADELEGMEE